jgi:hypothetical protein
LIGVDDNRRIVGRGDCVDGFVPGNRGALDIAHFAALLVAAVIFLLRAILQIGLALTFSECGFSIGHGTSRGCWSDSIAENAPGGSYVIHRESLRPRRLFARDRRSIAVCCFV